MRIFNKSKKTTVSSDAKILTSFIDISLGLLKKSNPRSIVFKTRFGIHTFGLCTPIDVIILDDLGKVVKLGVSIKPNRIFFWNPRYFRVLELPQSAIKNSKTDIGDTLELG